MTVERDCPCGKHFVFTRLDAGDEVRLPRHHELGGSRIVHPSGRGRATPIPDAQNPICEYSGSVA